MRGEGRIVLKSYGASSILEELSYKYPLKLLAPDVTHNGGSSIVYILSYGGGLVGGDILDLSVSVEEHASLVLFTQGSTKVFKSRGLPESVDMTRQHIVFRLSPQSFLYLLPDPVTCYDSASYEQIQTFHLCTSSNAVVVDWFTSGRMSRGEQWQFQYYKSVNQFYVDGHLAGYDSLLLKNGDLQRPLEIRLRPYACYATIFLFGATVHTLIRGTLDQTECAQQMQRTAAPSLLWSLSNLGDSMTIIRVAAKETEAVKDWLRVNLADLEVLIGGDTFRNAFL